MNVTQLTATLPSGNKAVYEIDRTVAEHTRLYPGQSANGALISYGILVAVKNGDTWYDNRANRAAWSVRITNPAEIAKLEAVPHVLEA